MLEKLFGGSKRASRNEAPTLSPSVKAAILEAVGGSSVPSMPDQAHRAFQLAINPRAEAQEFISVIESDEALSARVLKIANSVYFDRGTPTRTIDEAILVIGMDELRALLNSTALRELFPSPSPLRRMLWRHDIAVGIAARELGRRLRPSRTDFLFLAGLMHDVGKLLLLQRCGAEYGKALAKAEREGLPLHEAEGEIFPFDHTEVGQLIGERWRFPVELVQVIRTHHAPWASLVGAEDARLVKAADLLVHASGFAHPPTFHRIRARAEESLEELWSALGIANGAKEILPRVKSAIETELDLYEGGGER